MKLETLLKIKQENLPSDRLALTATVLTRRQYYSSCDNSHILACADIATSYITSLLAITPQLVRDLYPRVI